MREVEEKGSFQKSLFPPFLAFSGLATDFGHFAHPKPSLHKSVKIGHLYIGPRPD